MGKACRFKLLISKKTKSLEGKFKSRKLVCFNVKIIFRLEKEGMENYYIWVGLSVSSCKSLDSNKSSLKNSFPDSDSA